MYIVYKDRNLEDNIAVGRARVVHSSAKAYLPTHTPLKMSLVVLIRTVVFGLSPCYNNCIVETATE